VCVCVCVCMRCALGKYRKARGWEGDGHAVKCSSDTEFTSAVLQKTGCFVHWWQHPFFKENDACPSGVFQTYLLALTRYVVNEAFKKEVL